MKKIKILYTEDDETIALLTRDNLEPSYEVIHFENGTDALRAFASTDFDICLLDIMMPRMDGFDLAAEIRKVNNNIPIIFISAKTLKEDRIKGLKIGADDYIVKPFSIEELILKIEIFLRRSGKRAPAQVLIYNLEHFTFDFDNYELKINERRVILTQREAELLRYFIDHKNQVLKRESILLAIWGSDDYFLGRSLDVFISRLRKIFAPVAGVQIENLHGIGFKFKA